MISGCSLDLRLKGSGKHSNLIQRQCLQLQIGSQNSNNGYIGLTNEKLSPCRLFATMLDSGCWARV